MRISIIGNAGGGKSRLARVVADTLGLPLLVIDDVQWLPGWQPASNVEELHAEWMARQDWVIDGWGPQIAQLFERSDAIVFVDFPVWRHYWWATKRHVKVLLGTAEGWPPPGCAARVIYLRLLDHMWRVHKLLRPQYLRMCEERFSDSLVHITSPRALEQFQRELREGSGKMFPRSERART